MAKKLPRLRMDLDFMPSPVADRPGLLIRDGLGYTDVNVIIPPPLVGCLQLFDGEGTDLDLRELLVRITGDLRVGEIESNLVESLSQAGFLEDDVYSSLRDARRAQFAASPVRRGAPAGAAYPAEPERLAALLNSMLDAGGQLQFEDGLVGIAAPHVSFDGGQACYGAAYGALQEGLRDRTFVILGTSHHGPAEKFGLTRKGFETPLGTATTAADLVDDLVRMAPAGVEIEDYHHSVEDSVEFQVLLLQHLFGPEVRILPGLCGAFAQSIYDGGLPEDDPGVGEFLGALRTLAGKHGDRLFWILGIDLAHQGRRYGDRDPAMAGRGAMDEAARRDRRRLEFVGAGDAVAFWRDVQAGADPLRWCGASALYTFLKALPDVRGELLRYEQWNIDEASVVSFAAVAFRSGPTAAGQPSSSPGASGV
jgi:AmmeMemoRadiSam system protein B